MYKINKGVDRPPEVLGIRGMDYLIFLAVATVALLVVTMLVMLITGIRGVYCFSCYLVAVFILYGYLAKQSRLHGERGSAKQDARARIPKVILVRSSQSFKQLRKKGSVQS